MTIDQKQLLVSSKTAWIACGNNSIVIQQGGSNADEARQMPFVGLVIALAMRPGSRNDVAILTSNEVAVASIHQHAFKHYKESTENPWKAISWNPGGDILAVASKSCILILSVAGENLELVERLPAHGKLACHICWSESTELLVCSDGGSFVWTWKGAKQGEQAMENPITPIPMPYGLPRCLIPGPGPGLYLMTYDARVSLFSPSDIIQQAQPPLQLGDPGDIKNVSDSFLDLTGKFKESSSSGLFDIFKPNESAPTVPAAFLLDTQQDSGSKSRLVLTDCSSIKVEFDLISSRPDIATTTSMSANRSYVFVGSSTGRLVEVFDVQGGQDPSDCSLQLLLTVELETTSLQVGGSVRLCGLSILLLTSRSLSTSRSLQLGALYGPVAIGDSNKPSANFFTKLTKAGGLGATKLSGLYLDVFDLPINGINEEISNNQPLVATPRYESRVDVEIKDLLTRMMGEMETRLMTKIGKIESKLDECLSRLAR